MEVVIALVICALLAAFVIAPLRRREGNAQSAPQESAELDREQGKLTRADWERLDAELRREAIAVLKRIDDVDASPL